MMIGNILDNTTELHMIKYAFGEIFSSGGTTLCKNPSDQTVTYYFFLKTMNLKVLLIVFLSIEYIHGLSCYPCDWAFEPNLDREIGATCNVSTYFIVI